GPWITQGRDLDLALPRVARDQLAVAVARVADQLGETFADPALEDPGEALHAELLGMAFAGPLAVELGQAPHRGVTAQRNVPSSRQLEECRQQTMVAVDVAVRIDVARRPAHQLDEAADLPRELELQAAVLVRPAVARFVPVRDVGMEVHVESEAEP